jgi:hypothetical protein
MGEGLGEQESALGRRNFYDNVTNATSMANPSYVLRTIHC